VQIAGALRYRINDSVTRDKRRRASQLSSIYASREDASERIGSRHDNVVYDFIALGDVRRAGRNVSSRHWDRVL